MAREVDAMLAVFSSAKGHLGVSFSGSPFTWLNNREEAIKTFRDLESRPNVVTFTSAAGNECLRFKVVPAGYEARFEWESA